MTRDLATTQPRPAVESMAELVAHNPLGIYGRPATVRPASEWDPRALERMLADLERR